MKKIFLIGENHTSHIIDLKCINDSNNIMLFGEYGMKKKYDKYNIKECDKIVSNLGSAIYAYAGLNSSSMEDIIFYENLTPYLFSQLEYIEHDYLKYIEPNTVNNWKSLASIQLRGFIIYLMEKIGIDFETQINLLTHLINDEHLAAISITEELVNINICNNILLLDNESCDAIAVIVGKNHTSHIKKLLCDKYNITEISV